MPRKRLLKAKAPPDWASLLSDSTHDVRRLSNVIRFSSIPVTYSESTAEHSFWVALYALMIYRELPSSGTSHEEASVLRHALTHDLSECVGGDVVRTLKYATKRMKRAVDHAEGILVRKLLPDRVASLAIEPSPVVQAVVKAADFMSLFHFMRREAARHNYEIIPFYWRMVRDIESATSSAVPALRPLYEEMARESRSLAEDCFRGVPAPAAAGLPPHSNSCLCDACMGSSTVSHRDRCGCHNCRSLRRWYREI